MRFFLSVLFFVAQLAGFSQHTSFYTIGSKELEGIDIYDIHQTKEGIYWLATNEGLLSYNGYVFKPVACPEALSNEIFDLTEDYSGNLFFYNLSGQIFRYANRGCELFYTISDSLMQADMDMDVDNLNRLVISAKRLIILGQDKKVKLVSAASTHALSTLHSITRRTDSTLVISGRPANAMLLLKHDKIETKKLRATGLDPAHTLKTLISGNKIFPYLSPGWQIFGINNDSLFRVADPHFVVPEQKIVRYYSASGSVWLATNTNGVFRYDENFRVMHKGQPLFPDVFISNVFEDSESNILLGTFGNGIYVIPNLDAENISVPLPGEKIISVSFSLSGDLFFGTRSGKIFRREPGGQMSLYRNKQNKNIELLQHLGHNNLLIGEFNAVIHNVEKQSDYELKIGSVKGFCTVTDREFLLATNNGAYRFNLKTLEYEPVPELRLRLYDIGYSPARKTMYAATAKGLVKLESGKKLEYLEPDGRNVVTQDIEIAGDLVFAATSDNGVLVFKNDSLRQRWDVKTGLVSSRISKIKVRDSKLCIATNRGIQVLGLDGKTLHIINQSAGLVSENILDFELKDDELWIVHSEGIQKVMLPHSDVPSFIPKISIDEIRVNDSLPAAGQSDFNATQKKIAFNLRVSNLRYRNEIKYNYILEGAETAWQQNAFDDHIIEYKSLSPGTYTFKINASCRGLTSETVAYTFTIHAPFWKTWWFISLIFAFLLLLISLYFSKRLKRQQLEAKRRNELNASRLAAIQSQMNPHFIFNALNSIQDLILKKDVEQSYDYITKFANLVRSTLKYSDKDFIALESELKLIGLYLALEKMRFKDDLEFTIITNGISDIHIPPMLIQPFIENALVHGLLHKTGPKRITIEFKLEAELFCSITDNGIGRVRAKQIKERQRKMHESFSSNAIAKRFEILEQNFGGSLGYSYEDLEEAGEPAGTRVTLRIPYKRYF
ncbi:MAG: regulator of cell autolysi [Bacteroidetes bacterium]|nr:MAG: regulator of cell autolysi [Bacteroidota bacterium]